MRYLRLAVLALVLAVLAPVGTPLVAVVPAATAMTGLLVQAMRFSTDRFGWALVQDQGTGTLHLIVSADGGVTWGEVTSAVMAGPGRLAGDPFFLGGADGWVPLDQAATDHARAGLLVARTTDGGRHWEPGHVFAGPAQADVFFLNKTTGWLEATAGAATGCMPAQIYATHDSGLTWREVSASPLCGGTEGTAGGIAAGCDKTGISFSSARIGFAALACNGGASGLARSVDGGRTWRASGPSLPNSPGGAWAWPPVFSGQKNGAAVVWNGAEPFVAVTSDSGARWRLMLLPFGALAELQSPSDPCAGASGVDVVTASTWVVALASSVYKPSDGGQLWAYVESGLALQGLVTDFVTAQVGWAWGTTWGTLFRTTDGGRKWTALR